MALWHNGNTDGASRLTATPVVSSSTKSYRTSYLVRGGQCVEISGVRQAVSLFLARSLLCYQLSSINADNGLSGDVWVCT